eukprot:COSAG02_NODE_8480_length_2555_cov_2.345277_1_plen_120_part_10
MRLDSTEYMMIIKKTRCLLQNGICPHSTQSDRMTEGILYYSGAAAWRVGGWSRSPGWTAWCWARGPGRGDRRPDQGHGWLHCLCLRRLLPQEEEGEEEGGEEEEGEEEEGEEEEGAEEEE